MCILVIQMLLEMEKNISTLLDNETLSNIVICIRVYAFEQSKSNTSTNMYLIIRNCF